MKSTVLLYVFKRYRTKAKSILSNFCLNILKKVLNNCNYITYAK